MKIYLKLNTTISTIIIAFVTLIATPLLLSSPAEAIGTADAMTMTFSASPATASVGEYVTVVASVDVPTTANPINFTAVRFSYDKDKLELASHSSMGTAFNFCSYANNNNTYNYPQYSCYSYTLSLRSGIVATATFRVKAPGSSLVTNGLTANSATDITAAPYTVNVTPATIDAFADEITSPTYTISRSDPSLPYLIGVYPVKTFAYLLERIDNPSSHLKLFDETDSAEITDPDAYIGTGMILKLIIDDTVYDTLRLVVRGDVNGDSIITIADLNRINNHLLNPSATLPYRELAMDLNKDGLITIADFNRLNNYLSTRIGDGDIN